MHPTSRARQSVLAACAALMLVRLASMPAAAAPAKEIDPVVVKGLRAPELKRYRVMLAGLDAFDKHHALAPTADMVRFKLFPRIGAQVDLDNLTLRISGDSFSIPVPVAADGMFIVPRNAQADDEDADLVLNKKKNAYRWRADVRSANVPANMRRLGDLRLECQVLVATAKEEIGFIWTAAINGILLTTDWCSHKEVQIATKTDRKVKSANLVSGESRIKVHTSEDGFVPPLGNKAYSDDALIELEFEDDAATVTAPAP